MKKRKRSVNRALKRKKRLREQPQPLDPSVPRSIVVHKGHVGWSVRALQADLRQVMQPHTAVRLRERRTNTLRDYVSVSAQFAVRNVMLLTATERASYLRVVRTPQGPTLTFRLESYSLMADIARAQKRPHSKTNEFLTPPLVIMNNFGTAPQFELAATMFKGLFPALNVHTSKLSECRRVLLIEYSAERDAFVVRHYRIVVRPVGINRAVKKTVLSRRVPQLSQLQDVADYVLSGGKTGAEANMSDSEGDELAEEKVALPQSYAGAGNTRAKSAEHKSAVRMREIGPRMELKLIKIVEGVADGGVLYHALVEKSAEEVARIAKARADKLALKAKRRAEQEANVRRKEEAKKAAGKKAGKRGQRPQEAESSTAANDAASEADEQSSVADDDALLYEDDEEDDFERAFAATSAVLEDDDEDGANDGNDDDDDDEDQDDAYWYKQAVGEAPPEHFRESTAASRATEEHNKAKKPWFKERRDQAKQEKKKKQAEADGKVEAKKGKDAKKGKFDAKKGKFEGKKGKFDAKKSTFDGKNNNKNKGAAGSSKGRGGKTPQRGAKRARR